MRRQSLCLAVSLALAAGPAAAAERYSLTVYSAAAPGAISVETLQNYGLQLPGYALVRDSRNIDLAQGPSTIRFTDVAKRIDPTTVGFASLTDPEGTRVVEQNYEFDLVNQAKLLERFVGETITVEQMRGEEVDRTTGRLLSAAGGMILQKDSGEIVTLQGWSNVVFPSLPGGLITKPTLVWLLDAKRGGAHDVRVSYQTQGMTWWSDYNVTLRGAGGDDCGMDLSAWVTLVNQSGASYPGAQLKLVAGEVNRAPAAPAPVLQMARTEMAAGALADRGFAESSLFEYHLYTLGRRTDIPDNSTKQLELFPAANGAACRRQLVFTAAPQPWSWWAQPIADQGYGATTTGTVGAFLEFDNREANGLGMPLPAGRVRVNQAANDGSLEFIGEDVIKHTPRNETVRIKLGNAFDVVGERRQTNFVYDDDADYIEESFEISVRNRKKAATTVIVREYLYRWSRWDVTAKDTPFEKRDAQTIDFPVAIAADGEAKVAYTVRYSW
ncbi:MAG TPA: hypothetical protein VFL14_07940 [Xanthomonadales bacterium]|nr:hypothetical protein [Xanthomonadales bacterium]